MLLPQESDEDVISVRDLLTTGDTLSQQRIGVFDSGVGGLTVLKALQQQLPNESFLYFGDTARLPYGIRSQSEIVAFTRQILDWMTTQQVKMAVTACNTSAALALDIVRREYQVPIIGLILPAARAAVQRGKRIGVMATPATVNSQSYPQAIAEIKASIKVLQVSCPEFVLRVEQDRVHDPSTLAVAREYLQPLLEAKIDTLIYGCTHFPYLTPVINQLLPRTVKQIDPARYVAAAAAQELDLLNLRQVQSRHQSPRFCVSGCPNQFQQLASQWLGYVPTVEQVDLAAAMSSVRV